MKKLFSKCEFFEWVFLSVLSFILAFSIIYSLILHAFGATFSKNFIIFTAIYIIFILFMKYFKKIILTFFEQKYFMKSLISYGFFLTIFIIYIFVYTNFPHIIMDYKQTILSDFLIGTIAGLLVVFFTGIPMQDFFFEFRNNKKFAQAKNILLNEESNEDDIDLAKNMLEELGKDLHAKSLRYLGLIYSGSIETHFPVDFEKAKKYLERAKNLGSKKAGKDLGILYFYGTDEIEKAINLWKLEALNGDAIAQNALGYIYVELLKDYNEAIKWFRKSAIGKCEFAHYNLGEMYRDGRVVDRKIDKRSHNILSYMWYHISKINGVELAQQELNELRKKISKDDTKEAERMADECIKSNYKKYNEMV